ncbi:MAG: CehA/McbA family metallohydrolase [Kofleriaceae bacterium]|nr:CehA/McbA family metallohydrolase [Kofleriaceae bacterium]
MRRIRHRLGVLLLAFSACGGDDAGLSDYFPELPPEGGTPGASAGQVTDASQLVTGPATSGMVGDFFIANDQVRFIVQAPTRVIGVIPQGGNIVDAVLTDGTNQLVDDHFGELSMIYKVGRTCEPDRIEVVRDGAGGGPAVLRAIGKSGNNDFINLKGMGLLPVEPQVDPDIDDGALCATTYVLYPGTTKLEVHHSLFNDGPDKIQGPLGTLSDTGGETEAFTNGRGFERADVTAIATLGKPSPIDYVIYQGPGVAYGIVPRHETPTTQTQALIAGVSIMLVGNASLLEILQRDKYYLDIAPDKGVRQSYDLVVGKDGSAIDAAFRKDLGETTRTVSGRVDMSAGGPAVGARVGVFLDGNGNGQIDPADQDTDDDGRPDDPIVTYIDVAADGTYSGEVPADAGNLLLRAEVKNIGRSSVLPAADAASFTVPSPIEVDFQIRDAESGAPIPGRLLVIGEHPAYPDKRVFETYDRLGDVVSSLHAVRGTTTDLGDGADPKLRLPAGGTYRVYASRGTEWSVASQPVTGSGPVNLTFDLRHVNPTPGYIGSDWHVHQIGSPDSNIPSSERVRSAVSAGVEMFAVTDHDYVSNLQPVVEELGLAAYLRVVSGIEVTPFAYGHFNSWPITPDDAQPNKGAIDWARGMVGFNMLPREIFAAMRERGGKVVQVNHPRSSGIGEFQAAWSRANVKFDYDARSIFGDYQNAGMPSDYLRLPGAESLWSDEFSGLELWNGFSMADTNGDGVRENTSLDTVLRDWLSMLSLGLYVTPAGNSDTHTGINSPVGMPRTYVRVADDSPAALRDGSAVDAVIQTQTGANSAPRDVVVTNGPMIDVKVGATSALGRVFPATGEITLTITITSPDWAEVDTLEVFANSTPGPIPASKDSTLVPLKCWTTRALGSLAAKDPCTLAAFDAEALPVSLKNVSGPGGFKRYEGTVTLTLDAQDIQTCAGKTGDDAWLVFRVRGDSGVFPLLTEAGAIDATTKPSIMSGDLAALRTALAGKGVSASAVTSPVFIDFDGSGYRAPFAP